MEAAKLRAAVVTMVMIAWLSAAIRPSAAQDTATCASSLVPCANYINGTVKNPPASCCTPLADALKNQKACLCNIYNDPTVLKSLNINLTDALSLPARCKIAGASTTMCSGKNAADVVAWSGISALVVLMASVVLY